MSQEQGRAAGQAQRVKQATGQSPRQTAGVPDTAAQAAPSWEQASDEPDRWFARFNVFRALGPRRTLAEAYRLVASAEGLRGARASRRWTEMAQRWEWRTRATAWDRAERVRLAALESERRFDAREARLAMIDHLLEAVFRVLAVAELDKLARDEARTWLPTLRLFFKDLLTAQRTEWARGAAAEDASRSSADVSLRADDLLAAHAALAQWHATRAEWPEQAVVPARMQSDSTNQGGQDDAA